MPMENWRRKSMIKLISVSCPRLTNGSENWALNNDMRNIILAMQMTCLRRVKGMDKIGQDKK